MIRTSGPQDVFVVVSVVVSVVVLCGPRAACTMHDDDRCIINDHYFLNMRRWPSGWLVADEICLNGTQFPK